MLQVEQPPHAKKLQETHKTQFLQNTESRRSSQIVCSIEGEDCTYPYNTGFAGRLYISYCKFS